MTSNFLINPLSRSSQAFHSTQLSRKTGRIKFNSTEKTIFIYPSTGTVRIQKNLTPLQMDNLLTRLKRELNKQILKKQIKDSEPNTFRITGFTYGEFSDDQFANNLETLINNFLNPQI